MMAVDFCGELGGGLLLSHSKYQTVASAFLRLPGFTQRDKTRIRQRIIELYDLLRPSLYSYLCSIGMSADQAEDIIQETFLRLVQHLLEQGTEDNLRAWIFRVAYNLCMDLHRSQKRLSPNSDFELHPAIRERVDPTPNPEERVLMGERMRRLENAVAHLTPKQRRCVLLRARGLRYREIAETLGISVQRVGELMQRAITLIVGAA
jgi:RNA polymerase sigma-70 factor (ECF subfamily)